MTQRPIDALIFDLDGTLVNSLPDLTDAVNHVLTLRGKTAVTPGEVRAFVGDGLSILLSRALGTADLAQVKSAAADFRPFYDRHCLDATRLYDHVLETLDRFSSKRMAVISNKPESFTRKILEGLNVAARFEIIWGPESVARLKPDPDGYRKVSARFGIPPERFCCVGDRSTDILAGRGAGMMTVGVTYGIGDPKELENARPDALISKMSDLEKYVE